MHSVLLENVTYIHRLFEKQAPTLFPTFLNPQIVRGLFWVLKVKVRVNLPIQVGNGLVNFVSNA